MSARTIMDSLQAAIDRGVVLLNKHTPHWFTLVNLDFFDITVCTDCIVGQVFGTSNFAAALSELGVPDSWHAYEYGFDVEDGDTDSQEELEQLWADLIEKRQVEVGFSPAYG